jgi:rSAM/selenodomain-associated transferase 1
VQSLFVMAKAPRRGRAKTRMVADGLDPELVALLAEAFLLDTLRACRRVAGTQLAVCFTPREAEGDFRELAPDLRLVPQAEGDLGARVVAAFDAAFALGADRAVVIGSDTPHLAPAALERAFRELARDGCVLGPAEDGGYYLIGLAEPRPELFRAVEWSTPRVLAQTLERARDARLAVHLLDPLHDVDSAADLARLAHLLGPDGEPCPHTSRVLAAARSEP